MTPARPNGNPARRAAVPAAALAMALANGAAQGQESPGGGLLDGRLRASVGITSDYVYRGVSRTRGNKAWQAGVAFLPMEGLGLGAWASEVRTRDRPEWPDGPDAELNGSAWWRWSLDDAWSLTTTGTYYRYVDSPSGARDDYVEAELALGWRESVALSVAVSDGAPNYTSNRPVKSGTAVAWELAGRRPLPAGFMVNAGLGWYDLDDVFDRSYVYTSLSVSRGLGPLEIELGHYWSDSEAQDIYRADSTGHRAALSAFVDF